MNTPGLSAILFQKRKNVFKSHWDRPGEAGWRGMNLMLIEALLMLTSLLPRQQ